MEELEELFPEDWVFSIDEVGDEELVGYKVDYLDEGFVQLVDVMGSDMTIADGARTSFRSSSEEYSEARNRGLIRYLIEHRHTSPLELPVLEFRVKIPLFVRAQHVRHRTQSCNWESQRYQQPKCEYYIPPLERIRYQDKWNKQGSGGRMPEKAAQALRTAYKKRCEEAWEEYKYLVDDAGLSRETARDCLHPNFYSTGIFTMKLHNLFHYLGLRNDSHAQPEIHLMAHIIEEFVSELFPMAYEAWEEFDKNSVNLSESQFEFVKDVVEDYCGLIKNEKDMAKAIKRKVECFGSDRRRKGFVGKIAPYLLEDEESRKIILGENDG